MVPAPGQYVSCRPASLSCCLVHRFCSTEFGPAPELQHQDSVVGGLCKRSLQEKRHFSHSVLCPFAFLRTATRLVKCSALDRCRNMSYPQAAQVPIWRLAHRWPGVGRAVRRAKPRKWDQCFFSDPASVGVPRIP